MTFHINNLDMVQEAAIGSAHCSGLVTILDFGDLLCTIIPPTSGFPYYGVQIAGDLEMTYEFSTMAEALDFACDEARLATLH